MSAYGHQMEREPSARSLSSGEGSDMGSQFRLESVVYMSSCAATIFIGALVIVGILLMTMLIALTVMLQSCQSRSTGVIESFKSDHLHYDYCKVAALHAELNSFEAHSLPEFCKDVAVRYIKEGHYMRELEASVSLIESYFNGVVPHDGGHDVVLLDIDELIPFDTLHTNPLLHRFNHYGCHDCVREAKHMKHIFLLRLYIKLKSGGWPLILLSRKPEKLHNATLENLVAAGYGGWSKLIMRSDKEMKVDTREYFCRQKAAMQAEGYHIRAVISSHMDALGGPFIGTQNFKLPIPLFVAPTHTTSSFRTPFLETSL